jgi:fatty acid CoA ligase FadD9
MASLGTSDRLNAERLEVSIKRLADLSGNDPELRQSAPLPAVIEALQDDRLCAIEVFEQACAAYAGRPALGERAFVLEPTGSGAVARVLPSFRTLSYAEAWRRTVDLATGLARDPDTAVRPGEIVGILGFGSPEYVLADLACLHAGAVSAVLQMNLAAEDLAHLINEARYACLVSSLDALPELLAVLPGCPSVRGVAVLDLHPGSDREAAELEAFRARAGVPVRTLAEFEALGRAAAPLAPWRPAAGTDPLATLMYTSGSTGFPKGAMLTQRIWRTHWQLRSLPETARFAHIGLGFYPLSHAMGRNAVLRSLVLGGVMHFTLRPDMSTLFEDIRLVRPTSLNLVPRISERFHQAWRAELQGRLRTGQEQASAEAGLRAEWRGSFLGGRLAAVMIGSAPTAPEIKQWLAGCLDIPVYEGYGSTEAGILSIDDRINRATVSGYRLVDVPELGYRLDDQPFPRGELRVKRCQGIPGFFRNPAATRALYDDEGFLRTGDIVEQRGPDQVAWVDRINNVVKLAQGEYVTLWRLESLFSGGSPLIDQVFLYANSLWPCLLAVVVAEPRAVAERLGQAGQMPTPAAIQRLLRGEFGRIAGAARLRPFEVPREILVEPEPWTRENGLLTGVNKPARPQLRQRYGERLEALYVQLGQQSAEPVAGAPLGERVRQAVRSVLGVADLDLGAGSFRDLGGDSISALELALRLEELGCGRVPAAALLNPAGSLGDLARQLEARADPDALPDFQTVHGPDPELIRARDLCLERLFGPAELEEAARVAAQPLEPVRSVLLTGASGFLGRALLLEWLERMVPVGGRVYALVRAADDRGAAARLREAFQTGDGQLAERFATVARGRLVPLAGDLTAPRLGLEPRAFGRLAAELDLIVHPGALVNHVFSYEQLFEPNVLGTAQLIRLALRHRRKRFDYVSTIGVLAGARGPGKVLEADGIDALRTAWPAHGGYAHGYGTSKWAGEVLLHRLHDRFHTPVRVFRPSIILPDRRYRGQVNRQDLLTRLLTSVVHTGLAPRSFYAGGPSARAHFDGLPVDFVAAAMAALSSAGEAGEATYQLSNPHWDDGVSLDTLVGWVESAGFPVTRIGDHAAWFAAFGDRLRALPEERRRQSALPILRQWAEPVDPRESERVDASRFSAEVGRRRPGGEAVIPRLDEAFVHKYLADLRALGDL